MRVRGAIVVLILVGLTSSCSSRAGPESGNAETAPAHSAAPAPDADSFGQFRRDWPRTDFSRSQVKALEIIRGCPGRDCIPALDAAGTTNIPGLRTGQAKFTDSGNTKYAPQLPVAVVTVGDITRAYPLHILTWHEVINDRFGDIPVVVTFCPLCNTALAFDRRVAGRVLDFGVSGNLRNSDLIMWDRQTETWWQQATGEGIVGALAGSVLTPVAARIISFTDFALAYPAAQILTEDTGIPREYGLNPYQGYDAAGNRPFLFDGTIDPRLDGLERVVTLGSGKEAIAVPFSRLATTGIANVVVGDDHFAVFWSSGTVSALDGEEIAASHDVGAAAAYFAAADGRTLTFSSTGAGQFRDDQTGSRWDVTGRATAGPLAGQRLEPAIQTSQFWFAWAAFHPNTRIWQP